METASPAQAPSDVQPSHWDRLQAFRKQHQKKEIALFLGAGFAFDVFTLGRIDDWMLILQQFGYLATLGVLLALDEHWSLHPDRQPRRMKFLWTFRDDAVHFLFGSLLSVYSILYFKSSGGFLSLLFLVFLFALLIANELPSFRHLGHLIRMALFSFCLTSFFAYLVPMLLGSVGPWQFFTAMALALAPSYLYFWLLRRDSASLSQALRTAAVPAIGVQGILAMLYLAGAIPPVPLSIQAIGIYHAVEHDGPTWNLEYNPAGRRRFWQPGPDTFLARPGDRVYCFARIFAPNRFQDRVLVRWSRHDPEKGWTLWDTIPLEVSGGREQGFRGYAYKANYQTGLWRVDVETTDGRVIGTTRFRIEDDPGTDERVFAMEEAGPSASRYAATDAARKAARDSLGIEDPDEQPEPVAELPDKFETTPVPGSPSELEPVAESTSEPDPETELELENKPEPIPEPDLEAEPEQEPESESEPGPGPTSVPERAAEPEAGSEPEVIPLPD